MTGRLHPVDMSRHTKAEFIEAIAYIARESLQNARAVERAIQRKIAQLRAFPESAPADQDAPAPPHGATLRVAHVSGFVVRYAFPLRRGDRDVLYVVSIQRASRPPLDDTEFLLRFVQEASGIYAGAAATARLNQIDDERELAATERWQYQQAHETFQQYLAGKEKRVGREEIDRTFERALGGRRRGQETPGPRLP